MANSEKLIRLLKIISLIQQRNGASLATLVKECEVCERTIYRDIEALAESGMTIHFDSESRKYQFIEKVFLKPLTFTVEEAAALIQCVQGFVSMRTPLTTALRMAQERIMSCLPTERQRSVDRLRDVVDIRVARRPHDVCADTFECVSDAIKERRSLLVHYYTKTTETLKERKLDPYVVTFRGKAWYLVAFCHLRNSVQVFRLDRIRRLELLDEIYDMPANFSANAYFEGSWLLEQGDPVKVRLKFYLEAARWVRESSYHPSERLEEQPDGSLIYEVTVNGAREISKWILGYGQEVEVLEPAWLRSDIAKQCAGMMARYDRRD